MNKERAARAYEKIAEGYAELALAMADEQGSRTVGQVAEARSAPIPATIDDDLPPLTDADYSSPDVVDYEPKGISLQDRHVENALSRCPKHDRPWVVRPGGVSKSGKPYNAFWKCGAKDSETRSGYCDKRPAKAWEDTHPADKAA